MVRGKDLGPRVLVHHVEPEHDDVPQAVLDRALQHLVLGVAGAGLGDAEMADLALGLFPQQRRRDLVAGPVVSLRRNAVQLENVDAIDAEQPERIVEAGHGAVGGGGPTRAAGNPGLGGDHDLVARHSLQRLAQDLFGAVDGGGVEQIDPEVEGLMHRATASASLLPVPSPSRLNPPQPSPATLTLSPVRPSVTYSILRLLQMQMPRPVKRRLARSALLPRGIA